MYINLCNHNSLDSKLGNRNVIKGDFQGIYTNRNICFSSNTTSIPTEKKEDQSKEIKK